MFKALLAPWYLLGLAVIAIGKLLFIWLPAAYRWIRGQKKPSGTHGSAGFAKDGELEANGHLTPGGFLYGVTASSRRIYGKKDGCVHMFAKRGEGKSLTMGANLRYLADLGSDIVISDPALEHYNAHWAYLQERGYECRLINLDSLKVSDSYNPLSFLYKSSPESYGRDLESLCGLIMPEFDEGKDSKHFLDAAHGLLAAVMDWVYAEKMEAASISEVFQIITTMDDKERDKIYNLIRANGSDTAKAGINVYMRVAEREQGSFNSTVGRKLRVYHDRALKGVMDNIGEVWTWEDMFMNQKPVVVFIAGGLGFEDVSGALTRIIVGQCIDSVRRYYNQTHRKLIKPLRIFVDEADTLGYCKPLQDAVTQLRKADVNVFCCWQSISQIKANYKNPQAFIDGADWIVTGGMKDESLYGSIVKLMGEYTAMAKGESEAEYGKTESIHETPRQLMKIDELKSLTWGNAVILADRLNVKAKLPFDIDNGTIKYL